MKLRGLLLVVLLGGGCDLPSATNKTRCFTDRDCRDGNQCVEQMCAPMSGGDAGVGEPPDMVTVDHNAAPDLGCAGTAVDGGCRRGTWTRRADMPTPRAYLAVVAVPDGRIFALGGRSHGAVVATVEVYTPSADSWTTVKPMSYARESFGAALGSDGRIYVFGGPYSSSSTGMSDGAARSVEAYDLGSDTWITAPLLQRPHSDVAALSAADGRCYVVGGFDYTTATLGSYETWKPGEMGWASSGFTMTTPRSHHALALAPDGRAFAIGGIDSHQNDLASVEWFTPSGKPGWMTAAPMPTTRAFLAAVTGADGFLYAMGGNALASGSQQSAMAAVEAYSPTTNGWETVAPIPTPRWALAAAAAPDGRIYAIGGYGTDPGELPTIEAFVP